MEMIWKFLKKLKMELPYYPVNPLLNIHPKKTIIQKHTWTPVFTAALFIIAKIWKQPQCPLKDEWIKMWDIYTQRNIVVAELVTHVHGILPSHKREWNNAICSNMNGPRDYHTKRSKSEKDKYHISFMGGILKKKKV